MSIPVLPVSGTPADDERTAAAAAAVEGGDDIGGRQVVAGVEMGTTGMMVPESVGVQKLW